MTPGSAVAEGVAALARRGIALPAGLDAKLETYLLLLDKWNRVYNLTAIRDPHRMVTHHLLDALAVLSHLPDRAGLRLLDVGSGAGIPGLPLALARPEWQVTLLDSNHKKGAFLRQAIAELGIANASPVISRIEDFAPAVSFDIVISRAFSDLATFVGAAARLLAPGGRLVAMKGILPHEELQELPASVKVVDSPAIEVPGLEGERHLVVMEPA